MKLEDIRGVHEDHEIFVYVDGKNIPVKTYSYNNHKKTITLYLKRIGE